MDPLQGQKVEDNNMQIQIAVDTHTCRHSNEF